MGLSEYIVAPFRMISGIMALIISFSAMKLLAGAEFLALSGFEKVVICFLTAFMVLYGVERLDDVTDCINAVSEKAHQRVLAYRTTRKKKDIPEPPK